MDDLPTRATVHRSYDQCWFAPISQAEERHFWFRTRNRVIAKLVSQIVVSMPPGFRVLEAGCGTGNVLGVLEQACSRGMVIGMDMFSEGLYYARQRTACHLIQGDVNAPPFAKQFDLICLFDTKQRVNERMH